MKEPLILTEHGDPALLEPLTCRCAPLDLELGAGTLRKTLELRWLPVLKPDSVVRADADFWPSCDLLRKLVQIDGPFSVADADGAVAAERAGSNPVRVDADEASFRIRHPWDLLRVNEIFLGDFSQNDIRGTVREGATLDGVVILGEGSVILPGVYVEGVAMIGKDCKIGPNCYLRGFNFIGDKCHIGQAVEIKNSVLMTHVAAGHLSYVGDSLVCRNVNFGAGTITSNFRHDGRNHRSMIAGRLVDTGRRKFGAVLGEGVHTGIHTSIYPGRKIWAGASTRPGDVVQYDIVM